MSSREYEKAIYDIFEATNEKIELLEERIENINNNGASDWVHKIKTRQIESLKNLKEALENVAWECYDIDLNRDFSYDYE